MRLVNAHLIALLLIAGNVFTCANIIRKDLTQAVDNERNKRAVDFGLFVRNLLLKSATASNAKVNIANNILNLKTTTSAPRRRTTTTTRVPFFFTKGPFQFPFDFSGPINNKFNNGGYINFDYNDYGNQPLRPARRRRPTTSTTTTTTTTTTAAPPPPPPAPTRRRPVPRRPYGLVSKQHLPQFDYYDDYDYDNADNTPVPTAAPSSSRPPSNPPTAAPQKRPIPNRARAQGRVPPLRNRLVYQFRQPDDTSTNNNAVQPAGDEDSQTPNNNSNNINNDETSTNTNDYTDDVYDDEDNVNAKGDDLNNGSDDNNPNIEQENNSSDNSNPNINPNNDNDDSNVSSGPAPAPPIPPNSNFNSNPNILPFQGRFDIRGNLNGPPRFENFDPSGGLQYSPYNGFNLHYQPSPSTGYSIRYY